MDGSGGGIIVFVATEYDGGDLFLMNADGSGHRQLTRSKGVESHPDWSPDGNHIVFAAETDEQEAEIYIMEIEIPLQADEDIKALPITHNDTRDKNPAWSPDGARIVFESFRDSNLDIYSMTADGKDPRRLTEDQMSDIEPAWSPDSSQITFASDRDGDWEIFVINADGKNLQQLTHNRYSDRLPAWSPNGRLIAFSSTRDGNQDIYLISAPNGDEDGLTSELRLTTNPAEDLNPSWSPDGLYIVFSRNHTLDNTPGVYVLAVNRSGEQWLVLTEPGFASWRP
jgi:tol-pal system beta propeller repeat protein TolB